MASSSLWTVCGLLCCARLSRSWKDSSLAGYYDAVALIYDVLFRGCTSKSISMSTFLVDTLESFRTLWYLFKKQVIVPLAVKGIRCLFQMSLVEVLGL